MEIYLVRHTTPNIKKGICYGQTDIDINLYKFARSKIVVVPRTRQVLTKTRCALFGQNRNF